MKLARPPISPKIVAALAALISDKAEARSEGVDWQMFAPLLCLHGLAPRYFRKAAATGQALSLPSAILSALYHEQLKSEQMHSLCEAEVPALLADLESQSLTAVVLGGWVLAHRLYDAPVERGFNELSLLFKPAQQTKVVSFFLNHGYKALEGNPIRFVSSKHAQLVIECHFDAHQAIDRCQIEQITLANRRVVAVRVLGPVDEYLYLVHTAALIKGFQKLSNLLDLARFQKRLGAGLDRQEVLVRARKQGLDAALEISEYFIERFVRNRAVAARPDLDRWFERIASGALEFSAVFRARLRARLQGGWPRFARYAVKRTIAGLVR